MYKKHNSKHILAWITLLSITLGSSAFALPTSSVFYNYKDDQTQVEFNYDQLGSDQSEDIHGPYLSHTTSTWEASYNMHSDENWYGSDDGYDDDYGDDHDDDSNAPVPEPTTALLMSLGMAGVAYLKRRG